MSYLRQTRKVLNKVLQLDQCLEDELGANLLFISILVRYFFLTGKIPWAIQLRPRGVKYPVSL